MSKVAFLFPGQGAQAVGMAKELYAQVPAAKRHFDEAADILGYNLRDVCVNGPADRLNSTVVSQPAIFVASLAALESLRVQDQAAEASCMAAAGLSLGEYTALVFAGALTFADGLRLVQIRGEAMQAAADATPSAMVSIVGLEPPQVEAFCAQARKAGLIQVANLLCPRNMVVSGTKAACDNIERLAAGQGARTIRLAVAGAFHTELMKPADRILAQALEGLPLHQPRLPVWSNVDALPHTELAEIRALLVRQVLQPVLWEQTMRNLLEQDVTRFYEIGPGRVLVGLLKRIRRQVDCINVPA